MRQALWPALQCIALLLVAGCNIYSPFDSKSSETDKLELGIKCLNDGDYACAISNYQSLPNGKLKDQKLCSSYLAKTGVTLDILINVVTQKTSNMLGNLAKKMVPWSETKQSDADNAKTYCEAYQLDSSAGKDAFLFVAIGNLTHCAVLMAKADKYVANNNSDLDCLTPGNNSGTLTSSDLTGTGTSNFMCAQDTISCGRDIARITDPSFNEGLGGSGLNDLSGAINKVPTDLKTVQDTSTAAAVAIAADLYRAALASTLP